MRLIALVAFVMLAAGCAAPELSQTSASTTQSTSTNASANPVLGTLWLHADGQRTWMDQNAGGGTVDTPMASLAMQAATLLFPLTPAPTMTFATSGVAYVHIASASPSSVGPATIKVTLLIAGQPFATSTQQGQMTDHVLAAPTSIVAGQVVAIEVCLCDAAAQTYVLDTTGMSTATIPGPSGPPTATPTGALPAGPATTRPEGDGWIAERTDTAAVQVPSGKGKVRLVSVNGNVVQATGTPGFEAHLSARGATEQEARDRLSTLYVSFRLDTSNGLDLDAEVKTTDASANSWSNKGGDLELMLPSDLVLATATLESTNGDIASQDLAVDVLSMTTTNGDIDGMGMFSSWTGRTTNGAITGETELPAATGTFELSSTNGDIDVLVAQDASHGVDATAGTTNGEATLDFANSEPVGSQSATSAHVRTIGYDGKAVRTVINMSSTNGDVAGADS